MAVLKHAAGVRPLAAMAVASPVEDEATQLRAELAAQRAAAVRDRQAAVAAIATAREEGFAEGRKAGIASVERSEQARVEAVAAGIVEASRMLAERLATLDHLAPALARACLGRVFTRPDAMAAMVVNAIDHRLSALHDRTGLTIRVSGADFGDPAALAGRDAEVTIDPDLPSGACRMTLRLGRIDLDVPVQWAVIAQALDAMAQDGGAAA